MEPYQERVVEEKCELDSKLRRLSAFGESASFKGLPAEEQGRLNRQRSVMEEYSIILGERIEAWS